MIGDFIFISYRMGHLEKGTYLLIPSTTGCLIKRRKRQPDSSIVLVNPVGKELHLSREFSAVLSKIYHQIDLDCNGTLSRTEFNLFNWRTSGEEVQVRHGTKEKSRTYFIFFRFFVKFRTKNGKW